MKEKATTSSSYNKKALDNQQLTIEVDDLERRLSDIEEESGKATKKGRKRAVGSEDSASSKSLIEHMRKGGISGGFKSFFKEKQIESIAKYGRGAKWATLGKVIFNDAGAKVLSKFFDKQYTKEQQIKAKSIQQKKIERLSPKSKGESETVSPKDIKEVVVQSSEGLQDIGQAIQGVSKQVADTKGVVNTLAKFILVNKGYTSEIDAKSGKIRYRKGGKFAKAGEATFFSSLEGMGSAIDDVTGNKKSFSSSSKGITKSIGASGQSPIKAVQNMEKVVEELAKSLKDLIKNDAKDSDVTDKIKTTMKDLKVDFEATSDQNSGAIADILKLIKQQKVAAEEQRKTFDALAPEEDERQEELYKALYKALQDIVRDHPDVFKGSGGGGLGIIGDALVGGGIGAAVKRMFTRTPKGAAARGAAQGEAAAAKSATQAEANALKAAGQGEAATATRLAKGATAATGAAEGGVTAVSRGARVLGAGSKLLSRAATPLTVAMGAYEGYTGYKKAAELEKAGKLTHEQANIEKGKAVGGAAVGTGGALAGAAAGAAIGSVVPVVGTLIGGAVGGLAGWYLGKKGGEAAGGYAGKALTSKPAATKTTNLKPTAPTTGASLVAMNREVAQNQQVVAAMRQAPSAAPVAQAPIIVNNNSAIAMPQGDKDIKVANADNTLNRLMSADADFPQSNFNVG